MSSIKVSSWILGGYGHSWLTCRWYQMGWNIHQKCLWQIHQCLTSGTMSELHMSSKSLPGVLEDMDIPYGPVYGIRWDGTSIRSVCKSLIKIWHQKPCQDSTYLPSLLLDSRRTWTFLKNREMVSDGGEHQTISFGSILFPEGIVHLLIWIKIFRN